MQFEATRYQLAPLALRPPPRRGEITSLVNLSAYARAPVPLQAVVHADDPSVRRDAASDRAHEPLVDSREVEDARRRVIPIVCACPGADGKVLQQRSVHLHARRGQLVQLIRVQEHLAADVDARVVRLLVKRAALQRGVQARLVVDPALARLVPLIDARAAREAPGWHSRACT